MKPDETAPVVDLSREPRFTLGCLRLCPPTRELVVGELRQVLEPRIMQVLVALARRRGEVVSRAELVSSCWGGRAVSEDAINRSISVIRRLSDAHGGFQIETVARVGYRLDEADASDRLEEGPARPAPPTSASAARWAAIESSLDPEDYADFLAVFAQAEEAFDARRQKRHLEAWAEMGLDRSASGGGVPQDRIVRRPTDRGPEGGRQSVGGRRDGQASPNPNVGVRGHRPR